MGKYKYIGIKDNHHTWELVGGNMWYRRSIEQQTALESTQTKLVNLGFEQNEIEQLLQYAGAQGLNDFETPDIEPVVEPHA